MDWFVLIIFLILIIVLGIIVINLSRVAVKTGGGDRGSLIVISSPTGTDKISMKGKILKLSDYNKDEFNEDKLVKDITRFIKKQDVIIIGNLRGDQTRIKPDSHIHLIAIDIADTEYPHTLLAENKQNIMNKYGMSQKDWDRYWDDLCHMDIHEFRYNRFST